MDQPFSGARPPASSKQLLVFRVTSSETTQFTCLSSTIFGQYVHWHGRRSSECTEGRMPCEGCKANWPQKWKGYVHVLNLASGTEGFLEITATCCSLLLAQAPKGTSLRGLRFRLSKTRGGAKGRYLVSVLETRDDPAKLPEEREVLNTLRRLWRSGTEGQQT